MSSQNEPKTLLGISAGQPHGSAEILLKSALRAAETEGAAIEMIGLADLDLPDGLGAQNPGDAWWVWERILNSDGLIFSTPIITRTMDARLKALVDFLLGPNADAAIVADVIAARELGEATDNLPFHVDARVLKPRIAGFLAVGGSLTPQWKSLALPLMHTLTQAMSIGVVDQVQFDGAGTPRSIVIDSPALDRAQRLGEHVAGQLGRGLDDCEYLGEEGACPICHLNVIELRPTGVICATCGARGDLQQDTTITWTDLDTSVISLTERSAHSTEIAETSARHAARRDEIEQLAAAFDDYDRTITPKRAR